MSLPPESLTHLACPELLTHSACEPSKVIAAMSILPESESLHEVNVNIDEGAGHVGQVIRIIDVCPLSPTV
jgi:RNA binding exosome subunit